MPFRVFRDNLGLKNPDATGYPTQYAAVVYLQLLDAKVPPVILHRFLDSGKKSKLVGLD